MTAVALTAILLHLGLRAVLGASSVAARLPLFAVLIGIGLPLVVDLVRRALRRQFGADHLAGIAIATAVLLGEYLAGSLVVLMLTTGRAVEAYAVARASFALDALSRRMPATAHRREGHAIAEVALELLAAGDAVVVFPHEVSPVDGVVVDGRSVMDESYLTGEPFLISKAPGAEVMSGAINGDGALVIRAVRRAIDSRYARIMAVMRESEQRRPRIRRLGDRLGAWYTPVAIALAASAWLWSGDPLRFLAVLVVATPCPLLIAIPVAVVGSISLAARRGIIVRDPAVLEAIDRCRTIVLDKTGTLTYGRPTLTDRIVAPDWDDREVLAMAASLERYSKHPLAAPTLAAARDAAAILRDAADVREAPGEGMAGTIDGRAVRIVGRGRAVAEGLGQALPPVAPGLECVVLIDGRYAATYRFHDVARADSGSFLAHLRRRHGFRRVLLVSGDREAEVRYLAERVGIADVHAGASPEEKVAITRAETAAAPTLFIGDGINDAPALATATVGVAFGHHTDITAEAAGAVIMDTSLRRVDELFHVGRRMRRIALQSAIGGMAASLAAMTIAMAGGLPPVAGAVVQEAIDVVAVVNALRAAFAGGALSDY